MKFPYHKFPLAKKSDFFGWSVLRPIIPVKLCAGKEIIRYAVLIDSGADFCIFDAEIGEYLGLDVRSGKLEKFGGIQDGIEKGSAFLHKVIINIGGWDYEIEVGFSYDISKSGSGILGQKGFFDKFAIKFDLAREEIELKERGR